MLHAMTIQQQEANAIAKQKITDLQEKKQAFISNLRKQKQEAKRVSAAAEDDATAEMKSSLQRFAEGDPHMMAEADRLFEDQRAKFKELEERKEHAKKKEEELKRVKDENQRECVVCMDDYDLSVGVECHSDERHFLCKPCLSLQVHNSVDNDNLPTFEKNNCRIQCAAFCGQAYSDHSIAQRVSEECFSALLEAKTEIKERVLAADLEKGVEQRIEAQVAAIAAMSDAEKRLRRHRKHVIERILTLACPRCSRAFVGFEGCFALKCSAWVRGDPNSCCQFCAYCLEDCGRDAHPHVEGKTCDGNQGVFQPKEVFEATHRLRRGRLLKEYLADMNDKNEREELIVNLARELIDLDLDPQMFL